MSRYALVGTMWQAAVTTTATALCGSAQPVSHMNLSAQLVSHMNLTNHAAIMIERESRQGQSRLQDIRHKMCCLAVLGIQVIIQLHLD